jgi:hypothetical protein
MDLCWDSWFFVDLCWDSLFFFEGKNTGRTNEEGIFLIERETTPF